MRYLNTAILVATCLLPVPTVHADVFGSSLLEVTDLKVERVGGLLDPGNFNSLVDGRSSTSSATLGGTSVTNNSPGSLDADHSVVGTDPTAGGSNPNDFTQYAGPGGPSAFARAETNGSGDLLISGIELFSISEVETDINQVGGTFGQNTAAVIFQFQVIDSGTYNFRYSGLLEQYAEAIAPPGNLGVSVESEFAITLNGSLGGDPLLQFRDETLSNQAFITGGDYTNSQSVTDATTDTFQLFRSRTYTLTISHGTTSDLVAVPEPGSTTILIGMGLAGFFVRRRKA